MYVMMSQIVKGTDVKRCHDVKRYAMMSKMASRLYIFSVISKMSNTILVHLC